jgi:hypothetical protein
MLSDDFIVRNYGLRATATAFASNYFVANFHQDGAQEDCPHRHRFERTALCCAEKMLRRAIKKNRILENRKRNIPDRRKFNYRNYLKRRA